MSGSFSHGPQDTLVFPNSGMIVILVSIQTELGEWGASIGGCSSLGYHEHPAQRACASLSEEMKHEAELLLEKGRETQNLLYRLSLGVPGSETAN